MDGSSGSRSNDSAELMKLLAATAGHDRDAFAELYRRTAGKMYGICLRLLGNDSEAQDAMQDLYTTVWQKAGLFDPAKAGAITWMAILARNKAIDRLRRRSSNLDDLESASEVRDASPSPLEVVEGAEDAARLRICLDNLDERPRAMIRAAFLSGATYPQLAENEGVPLGTMKSWIRRGLQRLRECLEQ